MPLYVEPMTTKNFVYKSAQMSGALSDTALDVLLKSALDKLPMALKRRQNIDESDEDYRLINYHSKHHDMLVAELFDYTKGHAQPYAKLARKHVLDLETLDAPDQSEFIHSILYFGVLGNHVVVSQSRSLRVLHLENYINWLLREAGIIPDDDFLMLVDQPPDEVKKNLSTVSDTKKISFLAPVAFEESEVSTREDSVDVDVVKKIKLAPFGVGWEAFQSMLPNGLRLPKEIDIDDIVENRSLEVKLEVTWKGARKEDSTSLLDTISTQLRHVDTELDFEIQTRAGKITKDHIKLATSESIATKKSGFLDRDKLWVKMLEWLKFLLKTNRVQND